MVFVDIKDDQSTDQVEFKELITRVSEDIIIDNILNQIEKFGTDEEVGDNSLFTYLEKRFDYLINKYGEDPDRRESVREMFDVILDRISDSIEKKIKIEIEFTSVIDIVTKFNYIRALYEFFIIGIEGELEDMIFNYVDQNKDTFADMFEEQVSVEERKNLSYQYLRKSIDNKYTPLLFHLDVIIDTIEVPDNETVIELMTTGDEEEFSNYYTHSILVDNIGADCNHIEPLIETLSPIFKGNGNIERNVKLRLIKKLK